MWHTLDLIVLPAFPENTTFVPPLRGLRSHRISTFILRQTVLFYLISLNRTGWIVERIGIAYDLGVWGDTHLPQKSW